LNGAEDVVLSGFVFNVYDTARVNSWGAGVRLDHQAIVSEIVLHDMQFNAPTNGSAILMGYHASIGGDLYYAPQLRSENSHNVAILKCDFVGACLDAVEGANASLRGMEEAVVAFCDIDVNNLNVRGIQFQNSLQTLIYANYVHNLLGTSREAIKIDRLGATTWFSTARIDSNVVDTGYEGIDIDDVANALIINNRVTNCTNDGVSIDDDSSSASIIENEITGCNVGVYFEDGSSGLLVSNRVYANTAQQYRFEGNAFKNVIVWLDGATGQETVYVP
jgi:hypothetical protein